MSRTCEKTEVYQNSPTAPVTIVQVLRGMDAARDLVPEWRALQERSANALVHTAPERFFSVLNSSSDSLEPVLFAIRRAGKLHGLALATLSQADMPCRFGYKVLFRPEVRLLGFSYGGFVGNFDADDCEQVFQAMEMLADSDEIDVVNLNYMPQEGPLYAAACRRRMKLRHGRVLRSDPHWVCQGLAGLDWLYQSCSARQRSTLKRRCKKLRSRFRGRVRVETCRDPAHLDAALEATFEVSRKTYQYALGVGLANEDRIRQLFRDAAAQDWLRLYIMFVEDQPVAFLAGLIYRDRFYMEYTGYDAAWKNHAVGTVLILQVFEELGKERSQIVFDFGLGDSQYKTIYGNTVWQEKQVLLFARRPRLAAINLLQGSLALSHRSAKRLLDGLSLEQKLKRHWRNHLRND